MIGNPRFALGAVFVPQLPPERLRSVALAAEEAGLEELWLWEDCFRESGIATAAAALAWTTRLRVGIGLLPVPLRNVALTAMEAATLARMFPDRLVLGVGHGVQSWMEQVGARVESPLTLLSEYVTALRALLRGERVTVSGRYVRLDSVALDWPPPSPPPVLAGGERPRTLALAAEVAEGVILTGGVPPERVTGFDTRVVINVHAATGPDAAERLERERVRWGYPSLEGLAVSGDAAAVAEGVRRWVDAGADTVVLQPTPDDPDPEGFVRFVATEVRPLIP
jgi:alkanesulfonate monooxygenase SsuD/methylene tetrahydromethanopterin reductase-like flavin-dependent oxidoreductase (luciferase family)